MVIMAISATGTRIMGMPTQPTRITATPTGHSLLRLRLETGHQHRYWTWLGLGLLDATAEHTFDVLALHSIGAVDDTEVLRFRAGRGKY